MTNAARLSPGEIFLPFPVPRAAIRLITHVRTTLLTTSLRTLRAHGHFDAYARLVPPDTLRQIVECVAGTWLPMSVALAHYRACDAVVGSTTEQLEMGAEVGERVHGTFLGLMVRAAKTAGVTPWLALAQSQKLYERVFHGGGAIEVTRLGPKDARVLLVGNPLHDIRYYRTALRGVYVSAAELFCAKAFIHELPGRTATSMSLALSWV